MWTGGLPGLFELLEANSFTGFKAGVGPLETIFGLVLWVHYTQACRQKINISWGMYVW